MTKGRRKRRKEAKKHQKLPTIVSPSLTRAENPPEVEVAKFQPKQTVLASKEILIAAPIEHCFGIIASQLEQPRQWDTVLFSVWPVSDARGQTGATSHVILDLGGRKVDSQAMISHYSPYRSISWVTNGKPKVRQDWRLEMKPRGTMVHVTLAHELNSWVVGRLIYKAVRWKRVEQDLERMLAQLKESVESVKS